MHHHLALVFAMLLVLVLGACKETAPVAVAAPDVSTQAPPEAPAPDTATAPAPKEEPPMTPKNVRPSILDGSWYPRDPGILAEAVGDYLQAPVSLVGTPLVVVAPHAGYKFSGPTAGYAYRVIENKPIDRVIILAPSHKHFFKGVSVAPYTHFATPLGEVPVDRATADALLDASPLFVDDVEAHTQEHSVEIQLPLLQEAIEGDFTIVPLVVGSIDAAGVTAVAQILAQHLTAKTLVVVSSDFTHYGPNYGYVPFTDDIPANIEALDMGAYKAIEQLDAKGLIAYKAKTGITCCGLLPIAVALELLPQGSKAKLLHYTTSAAIMGSWKSSVSYLAIAFTNPDGWEGAASTSGTTVPGFKGLTEGEQQTLLKMARMTVDLYVEEGKVLDPFAAGFTITPRLKEPSGAFVTLKKGGVLRGCIGEIPPKRPLYKVVIDHAIDAAVNDTRFVPVEPSELDDLTVEVSVLTPPEPVDGPADIEIGRHGIYLIKGPKRAVYLPQVAPEQGWDKETTLQHLSKKAGLPADGWKSGATFLVFEAIVFGETE